MDAEVARAGELRARTMKQRDFRHDLDLTGEELVHLLDLAQHVKKVPHLYRQALEGRYISLLFEKPSLRTRLTFELAAKQLGGDAVTVVGPIGDREPLKDVARNLDRWTHGIVARVFWQQTIEDLAYWSKVPVVNALSDMYHPCQALADAQTLVEHLGELRGRKLCYLGDGNNVAHSLALTVTRLGMDFSLAAPTGYEPNEEVWRTAGALAEEHGTKLCFTTRPEEALEGASAVYTDVWASMGLEHEATQRRQDFKSFTVNEALMARALPGALFLHCLPAHRNEEVTDEVMESPGSVVFDQAENRLHAQKAMLLMLMGEG
ncbi:MAG: ornithine carbamoyltransferase [Bryobacterales bacterium]|nr:ornithine carbamoyltransferase [Bryobacterales bacterium]